jgi:peptide deformylase
MATMQIITYGDPVLRQKAEPVKEINKAIRKLAADMLETMYVRRGIGLAANQVGVLSRIIVVDPDWAKGKKSPLILINPVIVKHGGSCKAEEGCLSFPGINVEIKRPEWIEITAVDLDGREISITGNEMFSRVVSHELDHLNGVLFVDRANPVKKLTLRKELNKLKKKAK